MSAIYPLVHGLVAQGALVAPGAAWALYLMDEGSGQTVGDSSGNGRDCWLGMDGNADATDPTWATLSGVACLEFAGAQICYSKGATTLNQPYTMIALARSTVHTSDAALIIRNTDAALRGMRRVASTKALRLFTDTALTDGTTPDTAWFGGIGVSNGASSSVWISGGAVTTGNAGTAAISRHMIGARLAGGTTPTDGWQGQMAAAVILAAAASESLAEAWVTYLKAVKGVT